jgi:serine/threonine protein kinase
MVDAQGTQPILIEFTSASGDSMAVRATAGSDEPAAPGSAFRHCSLTVVGDDPWVTAGNPRDLLQRRIAAPLPEKKKLHSLLDALDNEIRVGIRLLHDHGTAAYPSQLARLVGYSIEADEPFALFVAYGGRPVQQFAGKLSTADLREFEVGLFSALRAIEFGSIVHGQVGPATIRWDEPSTRVQLVDFSLATLAGEARMAPRLPGCSPEQAAETGRAHLGDDVWSAGTLLYQVATGRPRPASGVPPSLAEGSGPLRALLQDVFAAPTSRPTTVQLLERLNVSDPFSGPRRKPDARFAEGQRQFDNRLAEKWPPPPAAKPAQSTPAKPQKRGRWRIWAGAAFVLIAVVGTFLVVKG